MNKDILSTDEAMVLQQIYEDGEDDIRSLSYELGITRQNAIKEALKLERKGMLTFQHSFDGLLLKVSSRGKATVRRLWPEASAFTVA